MRRMAWNLFSSLSNALSDNAKIFPITFVFKLKMGIFKYKTILDFKAGHIAQVRLPSRGVLTLCFFITFSGTEIESSW